MDSLFRRKKDREAQQTEQGRLSNFLAQVKKARYQKGLMRHFEWPLVAMVLVMSLWGVVAIFSATGSPVDEGASSSFLEIMRTQSTY